MSMITDPVDQLRDLFGEGDGDGAAERVADDLGVAHAQPFAAPRRPARPGSAIE